MKRVPNAMDLIALEQQRYWKEKQGITSRPTAFDRQNQTLRIGGEPLSIHSDQLSERLPPIQARDPFDKGPVTHMFVNPGPYQFGSAVRSTRQAPITVADEDLAMMMRPPDLIAEDLITYPIPDPTFMAQLPTFNKAPEYAETERIRSEVNGSMRFW